MSKDREHPIVWNDENVRRLWDYYSQSPAFRDLYFSKIYGQFVLRRAGLPLDEPLRLLDFGCGPGYMLDHVRQRASKWQYTGLDFSASSVESLNARGASLPGFQGAVHATNLPCQLPSASFDAVLLLEVVEHLADDRLHSTIDEARRLLKPDGVLVVSTPHAEDLNQETLLCPDCGALFHNWQHVRSWTDQSLRSAMAQHGLVHGRTWIGNWADHWWYGWVFNRAARYWLKRRIDTHMLATFLNPST